MEASQDVMAVSGEIKGNPQNSNSCYVRYNVFAYFLSKIIRYLECNILVCTFLIYTNLWKGGVQSGKIIISNCFNIFKIFCAKILRNMYEEGIYYVSILKNYITCYVRTSYSIEVIFGLLM